MVLTTTDNAVTKTMSKGVSHKAVPLLDKRSAEQSLQRVTEYVAAFCTEAGVTMISKYLFRSSRI